MITFSITVYDVIFIIFQTNRVRREDVMPAYYVVSPYIIINRFTKIFGNFQLFVLLAY